MTGDTSPLFSLLAAPLKKATSAFEGGHRQTSDGSVPYRHKGLAPQSDRKALLDARTSAREVQDKRYPSKPEGEARLSEFNMFDENNPPVLLCWDLIIRHRIVHKILFVFRNHEAIASGFTRGLRECHGAFP